MEAKNGMLTLSDAANYLAITRQTLYNWIKKGKLYPIRIMGLPYLPVAELDKILKAKES